jgi:uncharacterized YigZ family protein
MNTDTYKTLRTAAEGYHTTVKRSRFIASAIPVSSMDEVKSWIDKYRRQYHDARHICWACMLGADRQTFRFSDDGEPSSTAGRPILGQINSNGLTDLLVLVVRYFGGIELGTSGLIAAYRMAAAEALAVAEVEERTVNEEITLRVDYPRLHAVMHIVKEMQPAVLSQTFEGACCLITLRIRKADAGRLKSKLLKIEHLQLQEEGGG